MTPTRRRTERLRLRQVERRARIIANVRGRGIRNTAIITAAGRATRKNAKKTAKKKMDAKVVSGGTAGHASGVAAASGAAAEEGAGSQPTAKKKKKKLKTGIREKTIRRRKTKDR
jgi:hypothetical protein